MLKLMAIYVFIGFLGGGALAQPAMHPSTVVNPEWLTRPSAHDLKRVYPAQARRNGVEGGAILECVVTEKGRATDCAVVSESPPDQGFGAAALKLTGKFHFRPATMDGAPT